MSAGASRDGISASSPANADASTQGAAVPALASAVSWTNLAELARCYPTHHHYPTTAGEVAALLRTISAAGGRCRFAGAGKSPNSCTFTNEHLIHMDRMDRIIRIDAAARTVTCEGGVTMECLLRALDGAGLMLVCVPSYVRTTLAGCLATATHSSGAHTRSLSDYVLRLVLVDGTGTVRTYSRTDGTAKELALAACSLGALGAIVEVTLQVEVATLWHLRSRPLSIFDACDAAKISSKVSTNDYYRFWWVPHTDRCYESFGRRVEVRHDGTDKDAYENWKRGQASLRTRLSTTVRGNWLRHGVVERSLRTACHVPALQPCINRMYARTFYGAPEEMYGTSLECFTFDCLFKQWANEWAIPAEKAADALVLLREMIDRQKLRVHFPVELRFCAADTSALSPAVDRATCWIGIVMYRPFLQDARDTKAYYDGFNKLMQQIGGRPHWAKYYAWNDGDVRRAYGKHWEDFLALRKKLDPRDLFVNPWLGQLMSTALPKVNSTTFKPVPLQSRL